MIPKVKMTPGEEKVMRYLNRVGYAHITSLRMRYKVSRYRIHQILTGLWKIGLISRDIQGMAISLKWLANHPNEKKALESLMRISIK